MHDRLENILVKRPIAIADPPCTIGRLRPKAIVRTTASQRRSLALDLRHAIENNELTLHYQPQFEIAGGRACGVEALARWFRADGSIVEPSVFVPLAEQTHLIELLGSWVLREACTTVSQWKGGGLESVTICVNVSAHQINGTFAAIVNHVLGRTGLPAKQVELEITESALLENSDAVIECFRELKAMGLRIAIDDFGMGYSNLNYLSRLPVDRLKLDKSLIHNLTCQWKDAAILRSVIELGRDLGITVIAEGVETEQQFQALKQLGCPQVQGYWLARPTPQREAERIIARRWGTQLTAPNLAVHAVPESFHAS
jgi:EAL domain-containing protein (putative c-di-GMP-specific phosphodiesterase class I)